MLELMPSEVERIVLPYASSNAGLLPEIDQMFRKKVDIDKILKYTDEMILKRGLGLSTTEIELANNIWKKLSQRRLNRSK